MTEMTDTEKTVFVYTLLLKEVTADSRRMSLGSFSRDSIVPVRVTGFGEQRHRPLFEICQHPTTRREEGGEL